MSPRDVLRSTLTSSALDELLSIFLSMLCAFNPNKTERAIIKVVKLLIFEFLKNDSIDKVTVFPLKSGFNLS